MIGAQVGILLPAACLESPHRCILGSLAGDPGDPSPAVRNRTSILPWVIRPATPVQGTLLGALSGGRLPLARTLTTRLYVGVAEENQQRSKKAATLGELRTLRPERDQFAVTPTWECSAVRCTRQ